jgi:O-antigen ligase
MNINSSPFRAPPTTADWTATCLLAGACVAAPLALGSTAAWSRFAVEAAMAVAAVTWALSAPRGRWQAWVPVSAASLLMLQLLPLPDALLTTVSPVAAGAWKVALANSPTTWGRISVDPATTAAAIRRLVLAAATIVAVSDLGRREQLRRVLCGALCIVCIAIWTLGLAFPFDRKNLVVLGTFDLTGPLPPESWKTPVEPPISTNGSGTLEWVRVGDEHYESAMWIAVDAFGPYIYANHFASALSLTLPVLLGAWLFGSRRRVPNLVRHALAVVVFAAALWTAGGLATSRAGAAGLLLTALVFASLTIEKLWARRSATLLCIAYTCGVLAFTAVLYGGFQGAVALVPEEFRARFVALMSEGRVLAAQTALRLFLASPLLGVGLGTFGELFPRLVRTDFLLNYAHNDYGQWLGETGLVGVGIAAGFSYMLITAFRPWWQSVIRRRQSDPLTAGIWAGLAGLGLHTAFDWNLHMPANALLACVAAGLAIAAGTTASAEGHAHVAIRGSFGAWLPGVALAAGCVIAITLLARDAASDAVQRDLRKAIVAARIEAADPKAPPADLRLRASARAGERMFRWDSGNGNLAVLIGLSKLYLAATPTSTDAAAVRTEARNWFSLARQHSAVCRGLPEPVTPQPRPISTP